MNLLPFGQNIWILTLFPDVIRPYFEQGVISKLFQQQKLALHLVNIRDFATTKYKSVDDTPYGGGAGMVMRADILERAFLEGVVSKFSERKRCDFHIVTPGPRGKTWDYQDAQNLAQNYFPKGDKELVFICGRYEGIDERFFALYNDQFISLGDFILSGAELAVMTILDSSLRFAEGSLGNLESVKEESFIGNLLEHPQYTKPPLFHDLAVPEVMMSGHHAHILKYQYEEKLRLTKRYRPDLLQKGKNE